MKHKITALLLALTMLVALTACGRTRGSTVSEDFQPADTDTATVAPEEGQTIGAIEGTEVTSTVGALGDYAIEVDSYALTQGIDGSPVIVVTYTLFNNAADPASALSALSPSAYQHGIQLDEVYDGLEELGVNTNDWYDAILTGTSVQVSEAFALTSETAPVKFKAEAAWSGEQIEETIQISEDAEGTSAAASVGEITGDVGDYQVSLVDYDIVENSDGQTVLLVDVGFTNESSSATTIWTALSWYAYQNDLELSSTFIEDDLITNQYRYVEPGAGLDVGLAFLLLDETTAVDIEFSEFLGSSEETFTMTIEIP